MNAVQRGDIVWHAGAFNTEVSFRTRRPGWDCAWPAFSLHGAPHLRQNENAFNEEMLDVQFQLARDLADELGVSRPTTVSLRDVPGTTRAVIPHLIRNNITARKQSPHAAVVESCRTSLLGPSVPSLRRCESLLARASHAQPGHLEGQRVWH